MKYAFICCLIFVLILYPNSNYLFQFSDLPEEEIIPGKIIVKLKKNRSLNKSSQSSLSIVLSQINATDYEQLFKTAQNLEVKEKLNLNNVYIMGFDRNSDVWELVDELNENPNVEYAEPIYISRALAIEPNDPLYYKQHYLPQIRAPEAWSIVNVNSKVIIGILDSGVDWDHEDLADAIWKNTNEIADNGIDDDNNGYVDDIIGWDFVTQFFKDQPLPDSLEDGDIPDNNPMDFNGHGTHVAGIAGAVTNNKVGIASVASGVRIMPIRIGYQHDKLAIGFSPTMAEGFVYAADNGADIANLSYESSGQVIIDAARYAFMNGVLVIEAAGNAKANRPNALGTQSFIMSVAAVDKDDMKANYSNFGEFIDISAPGGDKWDKIYSTLVYPSLIYSAKYGEKYGTSMAAPLVASVAGLLKSYEPDLSVTDLYDRIIGTADDIDFLNPNYTGLLGSGRVNAYRALTEKIYSTPNFIIVDYRIDDFEGNNNGKLDPGENVILNVRLRNNWENAENATLNLSASEPGTISVINSSISLGNVAGITDTSNWEKHISFNLSCDPDALPVPVKLNLNINTIDYNQILEFYVSISPGILFVADFEQANGELFDYSSSYIDAFAENRISFDFTDNLNAQVDYDLLSQYKNVVWACSGLRYRTSRRLKITKPYSLDSNDRTELGKFLDDNGSLFLSGQDVAWDLGISDSNKDLLFLNNYLMADFVDDEANNNEINGIFNDPISDGLSFKLLQPNSDVHDYSPDVIKPLGQAQTILKYSNNKSAALRYDGDSKLVYFSFGGLEAVSDIDVRNTLMFRIIAYFSGITIDHKPLRYTDKTEGEYLVKVNVDSQNDPIDRVILCWRNNSSVVLNRVIMTKIDNSLHQGKIPAHPLGSTIQYFIFAETISGNYRFSKEHSFSVGIDLESPTIELVHPYYKKSISPLGPAPYEFCTIIEDNMGVDPSSARIFYWYNGNAADSTVLIPNLNNEFIGTFSFEEQLEIGDTVNYYFTAGDVSSNKNFTVSDTFFYKIDDNQLIDNFENGTYLWDLGDGWDVTNSKQNNGLYSITDSPNSNYQNNGNNSLTYRYPFDLSIFDSAKIIFYLRHSLEINKDTLFIEISTDEGLKWEILDAFNKGFYKFQKISINLTEFTGPGNEKVIFRFRLKSNENGTNDGVYIDDLYIVVSPIPTNVYQQPAILPSSYSLAQNYPNPFNPSTKIKFGIPREGKVSITVYNILGEKLIQLINQKYMAGYHEAEFNNGNYSSGIYFYRIQAGDYTETKKMIILK